MIRNHVKIFMFLSSYAPLFLILGIKNYTDTCFLVLMAALILVPLTFLIYIIKKASNMSGEFVEIKQVEDKSNQFLEYIIAYVIPFLGFNLSRIPDIISVTIIFVLIGILYVKSDLLYMNPVLNLIGYGLYKASNDSDKFMAISKTEVRKNNKIKVYFVSKSLGVVK